MFTVRTRSSSAFPERRSARRVVCPFMKKHLLGARVARSLSSGTRSELPASIMHLFQGPRAEYAVPVNLMIVEGIASLVECGTLPLTASTEHQDKCAFRTSKSNTRVLFGVDILDSDLLIDVLVALIHQSIESTLVIWCTVLQCLATSPTSFVLV